MGNTIQQYRCQIGTFLNNRSGMKIKKSKYKNERNKSGFSRVSILLVSVICILTSSASSDRSTQLSQLSIPTGWQDSLLQSSIEKIDINLECRYKYGNKQKNGLKIMHWNAGGKHLVNKIENIESVVNEYICHILGISEANLFKHHDLQDVQVDNYKLYVCNTMSNPSIAASRIVVYVRNDVHCNVREDLMDDKFSSIWLEVHLPRHRRNTGRVKFT